MALWRMFVAVAYVLSSFFLQLLNHPKRLVVSLLATLMLIIMAIGMRMMESLYLWSRRKRKEVRETVAGDVKLCILLLERVAC